MTQRQKQTHEKLVKAVHTSARYRNYYHENKDEYREVMKNAFGKTSSVALNISELKLFVDWLNMKSVELPSFVPKRATPSQVWKIMQLWEAKARDKSDAALLAFAKRIIKKEYETPNQMEFNEAQKVIFALEKMK